MANRLKELVDSVVFAGLRSGTPGQRPGRARWLSSISGRLERFLGGGRSDDPLYLTNRTLGQRLRLIALIALPLALLGLIVTAALTRRAPLKPAEVHVPTAAEVAKNLDEVLKDVKVQVQSEVQVVEAMVQQGPSPAVVGQLRNGSERRLESVDVVFNLTDSSGSQVGSVTTTIKDIPPKTTVKFNFPVPQPNAALVVVRSVSPQ